MYLFEWSGTRERESLRRLFSGPHGIFGDYWVELGITGPAWFGIDLPKSSLLGGLSGHGVDRRYAGDVDILVGAGIPDGGGQWRPSVDEFSAVEAKVSWFGRSDDLHATKEGRLRAARRQAHEHLYLGVRRAALLWIVVTEPVAVPGYHDWMVASSRSGQALDAVRQLDGFGELLRQEDPTGFAVFPWGAVAPGEERTEDFAGAGAPQEFVPNQINPYAKDEKVCKARAAVQGALGAAFDGLRFYNMHWGNVFLLWCSEGGHLFVTGDIRQLRCSRCK